MVHDSRTGTGLWKRCETVHAFMFTMTMVRSTSSLAGEMLAGSFVGPVGGVGSREMSV